MRPVFALPFLVRFRDHGAWPGISQYSISHLAFFISHFYLAFLSRISHFLSRIFISHLVLLSRSRIFISHLAFFYLASRIFISHLTPDFFLLLLSRISNVPYRPPYLSESKIFFAEVFQITSRFVLARKKIWGYVHFKVSFYCNRKTMYLHAAFYAEYTAYAYIFCCVWLANYFVKRSLVSS